MPKILKELFDDEAFEKILKWADSSMNYPEKAEKIEKLLKKYSLKPLDSGTNRVCYIHKDYPKVVFKVGFDPQGIVDNLNEYHKSSLHHYFATSYEIDKEGLILVQEKCPTIDYDYFQKKDTKRKIRRMLEELDEEGFILMDLGLDKHKNYGVDRKGNIRIIDYGYVELKSLGNFNCPHYRLKGDKKKYCKGTLRYNKDFTMLECDECENVFKIDVVLEGYTESKYQTKEKMPKYKPSKELDEFYRNFNKHRDRATLKQFVALSDKINATGKGEENLTAASILEKLKRLNKGSTNEQHQEVQKVDEPKEKHVSEKPEATRNLKVYHSTPRGIDVLKRNDELEKERKLLRLREAYELINEDDSEETNKLIRDLFFARFPNVAEALQDIQQRIDEENEEVQEMIRLCKESGIHIFEAGENKDEVHIAFTVEELMKNPWIVMSKDGTVVQIDLRAHMEQIVNVDHDEETDLIVTSMETSPIHKFDGDYENAYFGSGDDEDDEQDPQYGDDDAIDDEIE